MGQVGSAVRTSRHQIVAVKKIWYSPATMTWLAIAVRLGGFAVLMPLVLAKFTAADVSVWLLFSAIAGLQVVADFGFGPTFSREISYGFAGRSLVELSDPAKVITKSASGTAANPDFDVILSATAAMLWLYRWIALLTFLLLAVLGTWAVMVPIGRTSQPETIWLAWTAVALTTALSIYGNAYATFLMGANRIELQKRWEALVSGLSLLAQTLAVLLNTGLLGLVLIAQTGLVVQLFVNRALAVLVSEGRFVNVGQVSHSRLVLRTMWPAAWRTALGTIMSLGVSQGMVIAMANLLASTEAASVQLALRVMQIISQFSQVPFYTRIPEFNRLRASGSTVLLFNVAARAMQISLWIYLVGAIVVGQTFSQLLLLIGSQTVFPGKLFWLVLTMAVFAERFGAMHIQLLLTKNKAIAHVANGVTGVIWIAGLLILLPINGVLALPTSMLIAYLGFYAWYSAFISHSSMSEISFWQFEKNSAAYPTLLSMAWLFYFFITLE